MFVLNSPTNKHGDDDVVGDAVAVLAAGNAVTAVGCPFRFCDWTNGDGWSHLFSCSIAGGCFKLSADFALFDSGSRLTNELPQ